MLKKKSGGKKITSKKLKEKKMRVKKSGASAISYQLSATSYQLPVTFTVTVTVKKKWG